MRVPATAGWAKSRGARAAPESRARSQRWRDQCAEAPCGRAGGLAAGPRCSCKREHGYGLRAGLSASRTGPDPGPLPSGLHLDDPALPGRPAPRSRRPRRAGAVAQLPGRVRPPRHPRVRGQRAHVRAELSWLSGVAPVRAPDVRAACPGRRPDRVLPGALHRAGRAGEPHLRNGQPEVGCRAPDPRPRDRARSRRCAGDRSRPAAHRGGFDRRR